MERPAIHDPGNTVAVLNRGVVLVCPLAPHQSQRDTGFAYRAQSTPALLPLAGSPTCAAVAADGDRYRFELVHCARVVCMWVVMLGMSRGSVRVLRDRRRRRRPLQGLATGDQAQTQGADSARSEGAWRRDVYRDNRGGTNTVGNERTTG